MIQTINLSPESFPTLPCVRTFEYTMAQSKLSIERVNLLIFVNIFLDNCPFIDRSNSKLATVRSFRSKEG